MAMSEAELKAIEKRCNDAMRFNGPGVMTQGPTEEEALALVAEVRRLRDGLERIAKADCAARAPGHVCGPDIAWELLGKKWPEEVQAHGPTAPSKAGAGRCCFFCDEPLYPSDTKVCQWCGRKCVASHFDAVHFLIRDVLALEAEVAELKRKMELSR